MSDIPFFNHSLNAPRVGMTRFQANKVLFSFGIPALILASSFSYRLDFQYATFAYVVLFIAAGVLIDLFYKNPVEITDLEYRNMARMLKEFPELKANAAIGSKISNAEGQELRKRYDELQSAKARTEATNA